MLLLMTPGEAWGGEEEGYRQGKVMIIAG